MNSNVVDLGTDRVHAIGWRSDQDSVLAGDTKDTEDHIDHLVTAHAEEEVFGA